MKLKCAMIMDPLSQVIFEKDSSIALAEAAEARGWSVDYINADRMGVEGGVLHAEAAPLHVDAAQKKVHAGAARAVNMAEYDVVLLRKDPPFDLNYIYLTYFLEQLEQQGVMVVNRPASVRDANEKCFALHFPSCIPQSLYTSDMQRLQAFIDQHRHVVVKPLDGMGGASVFSVKHDDVNRHVIVESITQMGSEWVLMQPYIPEVRAGDKRILMINGAPVPYALARIPPEDDFRGNLAKGARYEGRALTARDRAICDTVGPVLKAKGLYWVGLDVIGDYLTEINVTSPTCIRQLDALFDLDIAGQLLDELAALRAAGLPHVKR